MLRWLKRIFIGVIVFLLLLIIGGPWALYFIGLSNLTSLPEPPALNEISSDDWRGQYEVWERFKEPGIIHLTHLTPYIIYSVLFLSPDDYRPGGSQIASHIAKEYTYDLIKNKHGLRRLLTIDALTIWLTNHWTIQQLIEKTQEIYVTQNCGPLGQRFFEY